MENKHYFLAILALLAGSFSCLQAQDTMQSLPPVVIYTKTNVTKAVDDAFHKQFRDAQDPQWYRVSKNYLVTFINEEMQNNALFKKNGQMIYHIRYGNAGNLPGAIRQQVEGAYADYNITYAVNVRENNRDIWVVNLEGLKKLLVVRVENGELEEVGNYNKSR